MKLQRLACLEMCEQLICVQLASYGKAVLMVLWFIVSTIFSFGKKYIAVKLRMSL